MFFKTKIKYAHFQNENISDFIEASRRIKSNVQFWDFPKIAALGKSRKKIGQYLVKIQQNADMFCNFCQKSEIVSQFSTKIFILENGAKECIA